MQLELPESLKGEQPKPDIKPSGKKPNVDISSEEERKPKNTPKNKKPKTKKDKIKIDRVVVCEVDKDILPDDAVFKGYQDVVVQEIKIITDNIEYRKEIYYSPSQNKTYTGKTPSEIEGEFGPGVKSTILTLKHVANVSESKIHEFLGNFNVHIAPSTLFHAFLRRIRNYFIRRKRISSGQGCYPLVISRWMTPVPKYIRRTTMH